MSQLYEISFSIHYLACEISHLLLFPKQKIRKKLPSHKGPLPNDHCRYITQPFKVEFPEEDSW